MYMDLRNFGLLVLECDVFVWKFVFGTKFIQCRKGLFNVAIFSRNNYSHYVRQFSTVIVPMH